MCTVNFLQFSHSIFVKFDFLKMVIHVVAVLNIVYVTKIGVSSDRIKLAVMLFV